MAYQPKSYKKFIATAATATLVASAVAPTALAADFTDVSSNYKVAVNYLVDQGIAQGLTETTFGVTSPIKRGDAAVMIANALGLDTENAPDAGFTDLNARVAGAVNALFAEEIINGKTETTFAPDLYITRQEMAKVLANAYGLTGENTENTFSDVNDNWDEYVNALVEAGITLGYEDGTFGATDDVTRGQFALFIYRAEGQPLPVPAVADLAFNAEGTQFTIEFAEGIPEGADLNFILENYAITINGEPITQEQIDALALEVASVSENRMVFDVSHTDLDSLAEALGGDSVTLSIGGKAATYTFDGEVTDTTAPELSYDGETALTVGFGADFTAPEVTATDDMDEMVTPDLVITNAEGEVVEELDTTVPGVYTFTYTATDAAGNVSEELVLTVTVVEEVDTAAKAIESSEVVGAKKIELTFDGVVADQDDVTFSVKKGSVTVNLASATFSEDGTSVVLETTNKLTAGDYTVTVNGVAEEALTTTVTAVNEVVSNIDFTTDVLAQYDTTLDGTPDGVMVGYVVENQYGEDITNGTSLTSNYPSATISNGTVMLPGNYKVGDTVPLTLIHSPSATSETKVFTVSAVSKVSEVDATVLYNKDGKTLTADSNLSTDDFFILVNAKDQYGNTITNANQANNDLLVTVANTNVATLDGYSASNSTATFKTVKVNGVDTLALEVSSPITSGTTNVTLISKASGKSDSFALTVADGIVADQVEFGTFDTLVASGEQVRLPVTFLDTYGNKITDLSKLTTADGVQVTGGTLVKVNGEIYLQDTPSTVGLKSYTIVTPKGDTAFTTVDVKAAAVPVAITGLDSDFERTYRDGSTNDITLVDFVYQDQYGRSMSSTVAATKLINAGGTVTIEELNTNPAFSVEADNVLNTSGEAVTLTANPSEKGTEAFRATLTNGTNTSVINFSLRVTDGTEFVSYQAADVGTVYDVATSSATTAYDKDILVYGLLADGTKVLLTSGEFTLTSSNLDFQTQIATDREINAATYEAPYAPNTNTSVLDYTVTINNTGQTIAKTVTFTKVAPKVNSVSFVDAGNATTTLTVAPGSTFNFGSIVSNVVAKDQYGVNTTEDALGVTFADGSRELVQGVTIVPVTGQINISANGTTSAFATGLESGEAFDVTVRYVSGATATVRVNVQ